MIEKEIKIPVINISKHEIKSGKLCYIENKVLHVFIFNKYRKWRWFYRFFLKHPIEIGMIKEVDTSTFKDNERLYLDDNNAGGLVSR